MATEPKTDDEEKHGRTELPPPEPSTASRLEQPRSFDSRQCAGSASLYDALKTRLLIEVGVDATKQVVTGTTTSASREAACRHAGQTLTRTSWNSFGLTNQLNDLREEINADPARKQGSEKHERSVKPQP